VFPCLDSIDLSVLQLIFLPLQHNCLWGLWTPLPALQIVFEPLQINGTFWWNWVELTIFVMDTLTQVSSPYL